MVLRSRGLRRPTISADHEERLPPGQYLTERWPVLHHGDIPEFDRQTWDLRVFGLVERPLRFSWESFQDLPTIEVRGDMHCVTRWTKLDNYWEGVPLARVLTLAGVQPEAHFVLFHSDGGYTANLPFAAALDDDVLLATKHDGQPLTPEHGFPLRVVVPQRYAWKSAKWLRAIELLPEDRLGFWEQYGYSSSADPWKEERFSDDT
jgi:DMSO/TMAO reductase YedYZ molybdopterin-dependent catalytic subunit